MTRHLIAAVFLFILPVGSIHAQKLFLTPQETFDEAKEYILSEEPKEALPLLFELLEKGYNTSTVNYHIGRCYLQIDGQKEKAVSYLERASGNISEKYKGNIPEEDFSPVKVLFLLGDAYRITNELDKSISSFKKYSGMIEDENEKQLVKLKMAQCENARDLLKAGIRVETRKVEGENSIVKNYNAVVSADEQKLFFMQELKFYDAVMDAGKNGEEWSIAQNITADLKSDGDFIVTGTNADGTTLYLTGYDMYTKNDIYSSHFENGSWGPVEKMNESINSNFDETHASVSNDGRTIYFTSNRNGGFGGLDIYKSELDENGIWKPAENLGPVINTLFNEETPFVSSDGKILYFSSQGHYNMGGYDIFFSEMADGFWQNPVNIGCPLNTTDDDLFYFPVGNGRTGYLSKFHADGNHDNGIYRYELFGYANPARYLVKGEIQLPAESGMEKENVTVSFIDKEKMDTLNRKKCDADGKFFQKLPAGDFVLGFSSGRKHLSDKELSIPAHLAVYEINFEAGLDFDPEKTVPDTLFIKDILFDFDRTTVNAKDRMILESVAGMLKKYGTLQVNVNGYTDSKGNDDYNLTLSVKRANGVKDILILSGLTDEQITVTGFGEKSPVAGNTNDDGTDNPEGRRLNRRVELIISDVPAGLVIKKL